MERQSRDERVTREYVAVLQPEREREGGSQDKTKRMILYFAPYPLSLVWAEGWGVGGQERKSVLETAVVNLTVLTPHLRHPLPTYPAPPTHTHTHTHTQTHILLHHLSLK